MKLFLILVILFFLNNCSFDNKSGIWNSGETISKEKNTQFQKFKKIDSSYAPYNKLVSFDKNSILKTPNLINPLEWKDIFYKQNNNFENFKYNSFDKIHHKSKKLSKHSINQYTLFADGYFIINDDAGNIIIYSSGEKKIVNKFNFYKKNYKRFKKKLNLIVEKQIIYVSDNLGYIYAYDFKNNKLIWAKNNKIPFSSNLKISGNFLFTANINNNFITFEKNTGNIIKQIPTEESIVQKTFKNNLSLNKDSIFYLNTYGTLYSIDKKNLNIKWFLNLNPSLDLNLSNLFNSNQMINNGNIIIITANKFTYVIDINNGSIIYKVNFTSSIKPVVTKDYLFLVSKKNLLILFNLNNGKIMYSYDINEKISKFLNSKKKEVKFKFLAMANNDLLVFLKNSYVLKFRIDGTLKDIFKLPSKIETNPIFIDSSILFVDKKKKLSVVN